LFSKARVFKNESLTTMMARKFRHLQKPIILTTGIVWNVYVFLAKGMPQGIATALILFLLFIVMYVDF